MFKPFSVDIDAEPKGKARPRVVTIRGFSHAYTPKDTKFLEDLVRVVVQGEMVRSRITPAEKGECLSMVVDAYFAVPASWSRKKRESALSNEIRPTKKPDADNVGKLVADALNGTAYCDDSQIADMRIRKWYAEKPHFTVSLDYAPKQRFEEVF